jgi:hypothetical protein
VAFIFKKIMSQAPVALPVILATWEAEIRRIMIQSQLGQIILLDPI